MKSNIFIPKRINVGYQNRNDTYTKKLAYVIYYDEKGKLRKEASWQSWRDKEIEPQEFDNIPTEGFVLNKKVGDYDSGWSHRHAYTRVYDPRGFEFEITIENLLYILENATSTKGKGLEGQFIYGWDGKDLLLMPIESPDYKEIVEFNIIVHENKSIKAKDLIVGATYKTKENNELIYMGKYDYFGYRSNGEKQFWFYNRDGNYYKFEVMKTIPKNKLIHIIDSTCCSDYANLFDELECNTDYSPIDNSKDEYEPYDYEYFKDLINKQVLQDDYWWANLKIYTEENVLVKIDKSSRENINLLRAVKKSKRIEKYKPYYSWNNKEEEREVEYEEVIIETENIEELFNKLKPHYKNVYLENGKLKGGKINNE
jgi:hypothetical protein